MNGNDEGQAVQTERGARVLRLPLKTGDMKVLRCCFRGNNVVGVWDAFALSWVKLRVGA